MSDERLFSLRNPWFVGSVVSVVVVLLISGLVAFVWVPYVQAGTTLAGLWDAICRAAGAPAETTAPVEFGRAKVSSSDVIVFPQMIAADTLAIGRGGTLAQRCTMCHGIRGMSEAETPNLAGQPPEAIYKQMRDFQSRRRTSEIMAPHARDLSDQDMRDLAAYYSSLSRISPPPSLVEQLRAPGIVQIGAPMRNIAPCVSCHGGSDIKTASPLLDGEPAPYIREQLRAFADGSRSNDIHAQMRNIARQMTSEEIDVVARYYSRR